MKRIPVMFPAVIFLVIVTAALAGCTQAPVQAPATQTQAATPVATTETTPVPATTAVSPTPTALPTQSADSPVKVRNVVITPKGDHQAGSPVKVSFDIKFNPTGGETFPGMRTLALLTELQNAEWSYSTALDGNPSPVINATERNLYISGWVLSYPSKRDLAMHVNVTGNVPSTPESGNIKLIRVNVQDDTGAIIPGTDFISMISYADTAPPAAPSSTSSTPGTATGLSAYTGNGDDIRPFTLKDGGGLIITGVYTGDANFIVRVTDSDGKQVGSSLFNQTGSYTGKKILNLPAGKYYLEIQAKGPWSIDLSPT
ncbi:MAG: hypothetical protein MUF37_07305 [Methanoregulaceae archaeon]|nr:hypothetical protein [Methanoregulaceae archaeon]